MAKPLLFFMKLQFINSHDENGDATCWISWRLNRTYHQLVLYVYIHDLGVFETGLYLPTGHLNREYDDSPVDGMGYLIFQTKSSNGKVIFSKPGPNGAYE
jgi:hypothetical protein